VLNCAFILYNKKGAAPENLAITAPKRIEQKEEVRKRE